jgi:hypothetical protein
MRVVEDSGAPGHDRCRDQLRWESDRRFEIIEALKQKVIDLWTRRLHAPGGRNEGRGREEDVDHEENPSSQMAVLAADSNERKLARMGGWI